MYEKEKFQEIKTILCDIKSTDRKQISLHFSNIFPPFFLDSSCELQQQCVKFKIFIFIAPQKEKEFLSKILQIY